jgi:DNA-directed RNA polymerase III subunit RPC6
MLESLEPSIALTGGPWYTDNELDTEFIQHLTGACLKFIRDIVRFSILNYRSLSELTPVDLFQEFPKASQGQS